MNILIFVVTMLMILSLMTYARLDSYRSSQTFQTIFQYYMENDERGYINLQASPTYDAIVVKTKDGKTNAPKAEGSRRLGVIQLINKVKRDEKPKEWIQTQILLKNLMNVLYKDQPFFKQALEKNPQLLDELIASIATEADALPKERQLKTAKDLANLDLNDATLNQILYKILHGSACKVIAPSDKEKKKSQGETKKEPETDLLQSEPIQESELAEAMSPKGYCALGDFLSASSTPKIRLYLAPKELLKAIFHDPHVVDEIIIQRNQLYKLATSTDTDMKELSASFKDKFDRLKDSSIDSNSLSYDVSKTNPKEYE